MISLLILVAMYGGPLMALILSWLMIGWKFSLSAAPAAYAKRQELLADLEKKDAPKHPVRPDKFINPTNPDTWAMSPEEKATQVGRKCIRRGPFAYFLTPQWENKIKVSWTPAEVIANELVINTGETLNKVHELGSNVKSALDLSGGTDLGQQYKELAPGYVTKDQHISKIKEELLPPDIKDHDLVNVLIEGRKLETTYRFYNRMRSKPGVLLLGMADRKGAHDGI
jgi:hypothetical protein